MNEVFERKNSVNFAEEFNANKKSILPTFFPYRNNFLIDEVFG